MDATFTDQTGRSVDLPLLSNGGFVFGLDVGKPNLAVRNGGLLNPRFQDQYSGLQTYTINGIFESSNAYQNAIDLAEIIKSEWEEAIDFDVAFSDRYDIDIVTPAIGSSSALTLSYEPGRRNWVEVGLSLSRVETVRSTGVQEADTPTASGSGPVTLQGVELRDQLRVERTVGRPNDSVNKRPDANVPSYIYKRGKAFDEFSIAFEDTQDSIATILNLKDRFSQPLGSTPLTLDFNGTFGYGSFNVVPNGSQAIRFIEVAGETGVMQVPQISLRVVR